MRVAILGNSGSGKSTLDPAVRAAADQGDLVGAIKLLRERTGLGLKESKQAVEHHLDANPASREQFQLAARDKRRFPWLTLLILAVFLLVVVVVLRR